MYKIRELSGTSPLFLGFGTAQASWLAVANPEQWQNIKTWRHDFVWGYRPQASPCYDDQGNILGNPEDIKKG